jgi:hypothetical protein
LYKTAAKGVASLSKLFQDMVVVMMVVMVLERVSAVLQQGWVGWVLRIRRVGQQQYQ